MDVEGEFDPRQPRNITSPSSRHAHSCRGGFMQSVRTSITGQHVSDCHSDQRTNMGLAAWRNCHESSNTMRTALLRHVRRCAAPRPGIAGAEQRARLRSGAVRLRQCRRRDCGAQNSMRSWASDFALCQTPAIAEMTRGMIRLVGNRRPKCAPAMPLRRALAFADSDPPLWDGLGSLTCRSPRRARPRRAISTRVCG